MNYSEMKQVYEMASDNSYHGGYRMNEFHKTTENKYLGGSSIDNSRFEKNVVPFGLFHKNINDADVPTAESIYGGLVNDDLFEKLFLSVGKIEKKSNKIDSVSKTRKNLKK